MKPTVFTSKPVLLVLLIAGATILLVSWDFKQSPNHYQRSYTDTVPKEKRIQKEKKIRDLDDVLDELNAIDLKVELEKAQKEVNEAMKQIDVEKIKMDVEKAMKDVDMVKIQKEVQESIAKIDMAKIQQEVQKAMKEVDAEKIKLEVEKSMKDIDFQKIQKEVQEATDKVNWEEMKAEIDKVKNIDKSKLEADMKKVEKEMKELGPKIEKEMQKAKVEIEKAKVEIKEYKEFVDGLNNDGLINKKEAYTIKHKDGELMVNGKKASPEVYSKYRNFLEKHKKFTIEKSDDDFDIDMD
ncbi:MAG: hypothetical protein ABUL41_01845 [Chitinophagaceae bacterium]